MRSRPHHVWVGREVPELELLPRKISFRRFDHLWLYDSVMSTRCTSLTSLPSTQTWNTPSATPCALLNRMWNRYTCHCPSQCMSDPSAGSRQLRLGPAHSGGRPKAGDWGFLDHHSRPRWPFTRSNRSPMGRQKSRNLYSPNSHMPPAFFVLVLNVGANLCTASIHSSETSGAL